MESKYYISINIENNQYIGKVFQTSNNQLVYTSKSYNTQEQATKDVRTFVITSEPPSSNPETQPKTITSTANYTSPVVHGHRRCCGR